MTFVWTELIAEEKEEDVGGNLIETMTDMEEEIEDTEDTEEDIEDTEEVIDMIIA